MAKTWGLKGNLGLAKLERGKVLLEFELLAEAEKAPSLGSILVGGSFYARKNGVLRRGACRKGRKGVRHGCISWAYPSPYGIGPF